MEAGERWMLNDARQPDPLMGQPWPHLRTEYDQLRRPVRRWVTRRLTPTRLGPRAPLGETCSPSGSTNLRTRVCRQFDGAGVVTNERYDFKGNVLETQPAADRTTRPRRTGRRRR